ncbi:Uncharacterised protein [Klebsiella pneumoniae]|nr:Uncharacterised protein [Klebsiella pneumoniae]
MQEGLLATLILFFFHHLSFSCLTYKIRSYVYATSGSRSFLVLGGFFPVSQRITLRPNGWHCPLSGYIFTI